MPVASLPPAARSQPVGDPLPLALNRSCQSARMTIRPTPERLPRQQEHHDFHTRQSSPVPPRYKLRPGRQAERRACRADRIGECCDCETALSDSGRTVDASVRSPTGGFLKPSEIPASDHHGTRCRIGGQRKFRLCDWKRCADVPVNGSEACRGSKGAGLGRRLRAQQGSRRSRHKMSETDGAFKHTLEIGVPHFRTGSDNSHFHLLPTSANDGNHH
jgi:hypothetical protein